MSIYDYVRGEWDRLRENMSLPQSERKGNRLAVSNDAAGAFAASKYIFSSLKANPTAVTEALPPDSSHILRLIENPRNPLTWVWQKTTQAAEKVSRAARQNLDKPAQVMKDYNPLAKGGGGAWDAALPGFLTPKALMLYVALGGAAYLFAPRLIGGVMKSLKKKGAGLSAKLRAR
jgi:hypothetical protein